MAHTPWKKLKRERDMCDERKENKKTNKKKSSKISKILVRLFDRYFILKSLMKFIEIFPKK